MSPRQKERRCAIRAVVEKAEHDQLFDGLSERQIAFITGVPKSSVNRQLAGFKDRGVVETSPGERRSVRLASGQHTE